MASFAVQTVFKGQDLLTPIFKKMGMSSDMFGDKASRAFKKASKSATSFGTIVKGVLTAGIVQRGVSALVGGIGTAANEFIDFDQALTSAGAKFPATIKRGTDEFEKLGAVARKIGAETQFSAADAAKGLDYLAMAGFNAEQAMTALPGVTDLATIAGSDLATASDMASDALGAFNLMTGDTVQLQSNLGRVMDVMAKTITSTNTDMEMLFESMKFGGPPAVAAGQSLETFAALAGTMANAGIKAGNSGRALRQVFIRLAKPPAQASAALQKYNIKVADSKGNMRDMFDILDDMRKKFGKLGEKERLAAMGAIFGTEALSGMAVVLNQTDENLRGFRDTLLDAGGTSKTMARNMRDSLGNQLKSLESAAIELGFRFLDAFVGKGESGIQAITEAIRKFDVQPIVNALNKMFEVAGQLYNIFMLLKEAIVEMSPVLKIATAAIIAIKVAQWLWNIAMLANPIGLIIIALIALGVGLYIIIAKTKTFAAWWKMIWAQLSYWAGNAIDGIKNSLLEFINFMIDNVKWLLDLVGIDTSKFMKFKIPDNTAQLQRQKNVVEATTNFLKAQVSESEYLSKLQTQRTAELERQQDIMSRQNLLKHVPTSMFTSELESAISGEQSIDLEALSAIEQSINFTGKLDIAGAPEGSTVQTKTKGAPPIQTELMGVN